MLRRKGVAILPHNVMAQNVIHLTVIFVSSTTHASSMTNTLLLTITAGANLFYTGRGVSRISVDVNSYLSEYLMLLEKKRGRIFLYLTIGI